MRDDPSTRIILALGPNATVRMKTDDPIVSFAAVVWVRHATLPPHQRLLKPEPHSFPFVSTPVALTPISKNVTIAVSQKAVILLQILSLDSCCTWN